MPLVSEPTTTTITTAVIVKLMRSITLGISLAKDSSKGSTIIISTLRKAGEDFSAYESSNKNYTSNNRDFLEDYYHSTTITTTITAIVVSKSVADSETTSRRQMGRESQNNQKKEPSR